MEAAAASFKTVVVAISSGFRKSVEPTGTPSTTYKGSLPPKAPKPRTRIWDVVPGCPLDKTVTPATLPINCCSTFPEGIAANSSAFTMETAAVVSRFVSVEYPVTITSSNAAASSRSVALITELPLTAISWVVKPR